MNDYFGQVLTISFEAKISDESNDLTAWVINSSFGTHKYELQNLSKETWNQYSFTIENNVDGYVGFQVNIADKDYEDFDTLMVKDLQIELGDKKTSYEQFKYQMAGNFKVNLEDKRNEISNNTYYIKIIKNNELLLEEPNELNEEHNIVDLIKTYELEENSNYEIQLVVNINEREYVLDNYEFNTDNAREIKGISTVGEYLKIQPDGEYIILNDLELSGDGSQYRFGTDKFGFNGVIDFNGHTITIHTKKHNGSQPLFYRIEERGVLKNLVLDYYIDETNYLSGKDGIFSFNYGTIENIQINLKECTDLERDSVGLLGNVNYGSILNFVINSETSLIGNRTITLGVKNNYGTIKNGYLYGENLKALHGSVGKNRDIGVLNINNYDGIIENVFCLVNVDVAGVIVTNNIGNIILNNSNNSQAKNMYSIGYGEIDDYTYGPTIYNVVKSQNIENIYYFADRVFNNMNNQKSTTLALWDNNFQNNILNSENSFNVDELVNNGYYPQLNMPDCMPNQEYIELPEVQDKDLPDILASEVLETQHESARVKITINNPSSETITNIQVKNINCTIESQEYADGKSEVIVKLDNPILCVSKYSVMSITTKGAFGASYTRNFEDNERILNVDLYKEINSIDDWRSILKSPTENYILMTDLDMKNESNSIVINTTLSGKIDGNNHTIRNIILNSDYFIYYISGELQNLNIVNCELTSQYRSTPIYRVDGYINNCHLKDIKLNSSNYSGTLYQGGFIGSLSGTVENCSLNNVEIINQNSSNISVGGIAGYVNVSTINNCYVQNLKMNILNCNNYNGTGGIVGCIVSNTTLKNCYATGTINSDGINIGGLVGIIDGSTQLNNSISKVNISGSPDVFGGIAGEINNTDSSIKNTLALGNLYTSRNNTEGARIVYTSHGTTSNNYYYENQKINGIKKDATDKYNLSLTELLNLNTYINKIGLDDNYNYDKINNGILPKLMNTNKTEELPNQQDIPIEENYDIEIVSINTEKDTIDSIMGQIILTNPNELEITKINIDGMEVSINSINTQNGMTYINFKATPNKYYDSYKIDKIYYKENDNEQVLDVEGKIEQQFYKEIYSFEDWQSIEDGSYQNYRLMNDLDFVGKTGIKTNVTIGRLEGAADGSIKTIKNINLEFDTADNSFIKTVMYKMTNIKFENVNITNDSKSGDYSNLIRNNNGNIEDLQFENVEINADKINYVGIIGNSSGYINNIKMTEVNVTGQNYVASLLCYSNGSNGIENVQADNITIQATGNNVGGVVAYNSGNIINNIYIKDSEIEGNDTVGGTVGVGVGKNDNEKVKNITAENIEVIGKSSIGGLIGNSGDFGLSNSKVINSKIQGNGNRVGGAIGVKYSWSIDFNITVENCEIKNTSVESEGTGGIVGYDSGNKIQYFYIRDSQIISAGKNIGGLFGMKLSNSNISSSAGYNLKIEGDNNVGGILGSGNAKLNNNYINADIKVYTDTAGGFIGKLQNENMSSGSNVSNIYINYFVGTITGKKNVGGQIGNIESDIYIGNNDTYYYYSNFVQADLNSDDKLTISLGIGSRPEQNQRLKDMYYYKYSTINGENPNEQNEVFISNDRYLVEEELKQQNTYTLKLKWTTSSWNFDMLTNNKYPIIKYVSFTEKQEGIDLPIDSEHIVGNINNSMEIENTEKQEQSEQTFEYNNKTIQTYNTYSVITATDGSKATRNTKLYVKDNNLYAVPSVLNVNDETEVVPIANNLILDSYNGKEYETVLGSDGKIYELKESIAYPENFVNSDIESIGNNLNNDSHEVEVTYKNGDRIKFNYQTGEVISSNESDTSDGVGLFDYLVEKISEIGNSNSDALQEIAVKYEESKELQTKLEETSVEEAIEKRNNSNYIENGVTAIENNETNNSLKENKYISMYNEETGEYEIYNEEELLDTNKEEVVSENEKIEANNLSEYYASEGKTKNTKMGIVWIVISIIGVGIILFVLGKKIGIRGRS